MINVPIKPTFPTTQPNRRYIMTPRIVKIDGVKTPPNVPKPPLVDGITSCLGMNFRSGFFI
jgi:hypothetical protein